MLQLQQPCAQGENYVPVGQWHCAIDRECYCCRCMLSCFLFRVYCLPFMMNKDDYYQRPPKRRFEANRARVV